MDNITQTKKEYNILSDGLIVAYVTSILYLVSFCYQYGFLSYFGIPVYFVNIGITEIVISAITVSCIFLSLFLLFSWLFHDHESSSIKVKTIKKIGITIVFFIILYFVFFTMFLSTTFSKLIRVGVPLVISFGYTYFFIFKIFNINKNNITSDKKQSFIKKISLKYGYNKIEVMILSILIIFTGFISGIYTAYMQTQYLIVNSNPETVFIKPYEDGFLTLELNKQEKTFGQKIFYLNKNEFGQGQLFFNREKIGPLHNGGIPINSNKIFIY